MTKGGRWVSSNGAWVETYLLGKHAGTEIPQRDLEASSIIIMMDLDSNQSVRANMERGGNSSSHGERKERSGMESEESSRRVGSWRVGG